MRHFVKLCCGFALLAAALPRSAAADSAVTIEPAHTVPGQTVTLRWAFTGTKVVVSGGRFGVGTVVTGRTTLADTPHKTTRYTFQVWYPGTKTDAQPTAPLLHAQYSVVADVLTNLPPMTSYRSPHGWEVTYLTGWRRDVSTPDDGNTCLIFFQPQMDSVERLAVAMMPASGMSTADLFAKIQADMPSHYDKAQIVSQSNIAHGFSPAIYANFTGVDQTHPGTQTQSIVLAFVEGEHAYVVSARTVGSRFSARQALLEMMVRSFVSKRPAGSGSGTKVVGSARASN